MIAVWIIAISFSLVGTFICIPIYRKIFSCSERTVGKLVRLDTHRGQSDSPLRGTYEYWVDGTRYEATTGWTNYAIFTGNRDYKVRYNPKNPQQSFLNLSGLYINCALGTLFLLAGIGVFILGLILAALL